MRNRVLIMHIFITLSIILLVSTGVRLNWNFQILQLFLLVVGTLLSVYFMGSLGLMYMISSAMQEICILLAATIIIPKSGLFFGALATSLIYTLAHKINWQKFLLIFLWGNISILLYAWFHSPLINIALHTAIGAFLIKKEILYECY